ncbi:MAG: S24/S26 family peptidase [Ardenticatenia bacterium]|nr:S24/S26 family peptidase [Ardenticatenia bacterium]
MRDALARHRRIKLHVRGTSMAPWLAPGDVLVVVHPHADALCPGDIVVRCDGNTWLAHRLVAYDADQDMWYTKGDNVPRLDPPLSPNALLGRVVAIERDGTTQGLDTWRFTVAGRLIAWLGRLEVRLANRPVPTTARRWARALHMSTRALITKLC